MRERFQCPSCGLIQWKEDACKRCEYPCDGPALEPARESLPMDGFSDLPQIKGNPPQTEGEAAWQGVPDRWQGAPDSPADQASRSGNARNAGQFQPQSMVMILALALALAAAAMLFHKLFVGDTIDYPVEISLASLNDLCPYNSGDFICQHQQGSSGRVTTVKSGSGEKLSVFFGDKRLRVESLPKNIGLQVTSRGSETALGEFLGSVGRELDYSDERLRAEGPLEIRFGGSRCQPEVIRVQEIGLTIRGTLEKLMVDIAMRCGEKLTIGRVCVHCRNIRGRVAMKPIQVPVKPIRMEDVSGLCKSQDASMICLQIQDKDTMDIIESREDGEFLEFSGNREDGYFIWGSKSRIEVVPLFDGPLGTGEYRLEEQGAQLTVSDPECSHPSPIRFRIHTRGEGEIKSGFQIDFEAECDANRHLVGRAKYLN